MRRIRDLGLLEAKSFQRNDISLPTNALAFAESRIEDSSVPGFLERKLMERKHITVVVGFITLIVAVLSFNSYLSPTGALIAGGASGSLIVAAISLLIALTLFARYFGLLK